VFGTSPVPTDDFPSNHIEHDRSNVVSGLDGEVQAVAGATGGALATVALRHAAPAIDWVYPSHDAATIFRALAFKTASASDFSMVPVSSTR
jgi:hypothetical protein